MRFEAAIQGIDIKKQFRSSSPTSSIQSSTPYTFGDPSSYANLSPEERQKLTDQMMGSHKKMMKKTPIGRA